MNYIELQEKANNLRLQGKSEEEIVEILREDINAAVEHCHQQPEDLVEPMKDLLDCGQTPLIKFLFALSAKSLWGSLDGLKPRRKK